LGKGGMGQVYRGWDANLGRAVAIKVILDPRGAGEEQLDRFRREATAAAKLRHPSIVSVHAFGVHEGKPFLAMDLVEGESFEALLRREKVPPRRAVEVVRDVVLGL